MYLIFKFVKFFKILEKNNYHCMKRDHRIIVRIV